MIGHCRPITVLSLAVHALAAICVAACAATADAEPIELRLRIVWGSGAQAPQKWFGAISAAEGALTKLQPLGIEADEAAALRLVDNQVRIGSITPRAFDGCDVTISGDDAALVTVRLQKKASDAEAEAKEVQVPLAQLAAQQFRAPLDELGGFLIVQRSPGDKLRVQLQRDHLVFDPEELFKFEVAADLKAELAASALTMEARLRRVGGGSAVLWQANFAIDAKTPPPIAVELRTPAAEGAYRLTLTVRRPAGLASKLVPWEQNAPVAARDVEFVVIDPKARLPRLTNQWNAVQTIDPTSSKWWQRVPQWTQLDRLPGLAAPRTLGNVKPLIRTGSAKGFVELPAPAADAEPTWQAYPLAVDAVGEPHAIEIDLPPGARQQVAVSIIEPDAAGRVVTFGRDATLYHDGDLGASGDGAKTPASSGKQRIVFWPRTATPVLLLVNQSFSRPAEYGTIRLLRRTIDAAAPAGTAESQGTRLAAAYIGTPHLPESLGAAEVLDGEGASALSVDGWGTFLDSGRRLAQELRAAGFNAAVVTIAADGSSLAPIDDLGSSPQFDTGPLASSGADPVRKDVLEALLRIFDREGLRLVPAIELAAPLHGLERLRDAGDAPMAGVACVGSDGRAWSEHFTNEAAGARYNILDPRVQGAVGSTIDALTARYGRHAALAGVALELSSRGYGVLPGPMWCLDDVTTQRFAADSHVELPSTGADRFQRRSELLQGSGAAPWRAWRMGQLTRFYADLAARLQRDKPHLQLVLCTENLFAGTEAALRLRQAVSGRASLVDAAAELGVDLPALAATPGVCLLRPRRLAYDDALQARAPDLQITNAAELDESVDGRPACGELLYHPARRLRLASFDAASPFDAGRTFVALNLAGYHSGDAARQPLARSLATRDFFTLVEGGDLLPLVEDDATVRLRRLFQQLPGGDAEVRVEHRQPATMRVYRTATATTVCVINESPWPVKVDLPLDFAAAATWRELGTEESGVIAAGAASAAGTAAAGAQPWRLELPAYGVAARCYETRSLRVGDLTPIVSDAARLALQGRIEEIEQRMQRLDVERPYPQLQNPDFELVDDDNRMQIWQPRIGPLGTAAVDATAAHSGTHALHLQSQDALGVAARSNRFPLPTTGQLVVRAQIRTGEMGPDARLYVWIEHDAGGRVVTPRPNLLTGWQSAGWARCETTFDALPVTPGGQMCIQLHLVGRGEAWVDDVELFDLRFSEPQRVEFAKRLYAARTDLDDGRVVDCLRRIDGYWPRYLVEYLPLATPGGPADLGSQPEVSVATRPDDAPAPAPRDGGFGGRVRGLFR